MPLSTSALGPLSDVRVLAISQYGAGPFGTMYLADLGADVIKLEDPLTDGDISRQIPPFAIEQDSLFFQALNRNKRSITLNLRSEAGRQLFERLVPEADVVFNNLRGDEPARRGLLYDDLKALNPAIVCTSLTGYGLTGPRQAEPGYDYLVQGLIGLMSLTGEPSGPPARAGLSVVDFVTGITAALGTVAAVMQARRTGQGCDVDVSLMDGGLSLLSYLVPWHLNGGYMPERLPDSAHPSVVPSQVFATMDGHIVIMCQKQKFFVRLCELMEQPALATHPEFATMAARYQNKDTLLPILSDLFRTRSTQDWIARFGNQIPCSPVNTVHQALQDPQVIARESLLSVPHPHWGEVKQVNCPIRLTGWQTPTQHAPRLGAQTDAVLQELLGLSGAEIASYRAGGAL